METKTININATSDWFETEGEAEQDCSDRLDSLEDSEISSAESDGWEYTQGSTSSFSIRHDSNNDLYQCSAERTLYFKSADESIAKAVKELSYDEYLDIVEKHSAGMDKMFAPVPIDVTGQLRALITPLVPKEEIQRISIPRVGGGGGGGFGGFGGGGAGRINIKMPLRKIIFGNLKIISSELVLGEAQEVGIPINETIYRWPYNNCTNIEQSFSNQFTYNHKTGFKIEYTKRVVSEVSVSGELSFKYGGFGGGLSGSHKVTTTIENKDTYEQEKSETRTANYSFKLPANTKTTVSLTIQQFEARRKYSGPVVLIGEVTLLYGDDKKVKKTLESILNEQQRTINIEGFYSNLDCRIIPISLTTEPCVQS